MDRTNEIVLFETEDKEIKLNVPIEQDSVWLNRNQMAELFDRDVKTIGKHINNALKEELDNSTVAKFATVQNEGSREVERYIDFYSLDMIISVGYHVKSQRGVEFRRWANSVLKDYILKGYAVNKKRLEALEKTVEIQSKMLSSVLEIDGSEVLQAVNQYTAALTLLDQYDHQSLEKPEGNAPIYRITYEECRKMVDSMEDTFKSDVFGVEKEAGKVEGIIAAVYQSVFGGDVYPSLEEKAANLLYFMIIVHVSAPKDSHHKYKATSSSPGSILHCDNLKHPGLRLHTTQYSPVPGTQNQDFPAATLSRSSCLHPEVL